MAGKMYGTSPWARGWLHNLDPVERAAFEEAIPDGHYVTLGYGRNKADATAWLMREGPPPEPVAMATHQPTMKAAVWAALHEGKVAA